MMISVKPNLASRNRGTSGEDIVANHAKSLIDMRFVNSERVFRYQARIQLQNPQKQAFSV